MISPSDLTREIVEAHRRWLRNNAGDANEIDACRQYLDKRLGAWRRIKAKKCICASINRQRHVEAAKQEVAQIEAAPSGRPIDPMRIAAAMPATPKSAAAEARPVDRTVHSQRFLVIDLGRQTVSRFWKINGHQIWAYVDELVNDFKAVMPKKKFQGVFLKQCDEIAEQAFLLGFDRDLE